MARRSFSVALLAATALLVGVNAQSALVVGGEFREAGGVPLQNLALWNSLKWARLAGPPLGEGIIWSVAVYGDRLIAAGRYNLAGTDFVNNIAQFDGLRWSPLGLGLQLQLVPPYVADGRVMTVFKGELVVGGLFDTAGDVRASNIARWNGASWAALGSGVNNEVFALTEFNGRLVVGGEFFNAGSNQARYIAQWDGVTWTTLGAGITTQGGKVNALIVYGAALIVGGDFLEAGGIPASNVARWDGVNWSTLGSGVTSPIGPLAPSVNAFALYQGNLILAGRFQTADGQPVNRIATWNGQSYSSLGSGMNDEVGCLQTYGDGIIAGGRFSTAGGQSIPQIAKWDGRGWSSLDFATQYDSYTWFHSFALLTTSENCSLANAGSWRAQYYNQDNVLVEDLLQFSEANASFTQKLTAFPYQFCGTSNSVQLSGSYLDVSGQEMFLSYSACTPSAQGCLSCSAPVTVAVSYRFSDDCGVLTAKVEGVDESLTYYADDGRRFIVRKV